RRMAEVMGERDGLRQVFVEAQGAGDGARDLRDFQRVGQAGAIVVFFRVYENLRFMFQAAEGFGVEDAVAVALKGRADRVGRFGALAPSRLGGFCGPGSQEVPLPLFLSFTRCRHRRKHHFLAHTLRSGYRMTRRNVNVICWPARRLWADSCNPGRLSTSCAIPTSMPQIFW